VVALQLVLPMLMQVSNADVAAFMNETTAFMDSTDWIERYAWFGYFVSNFSLCEERPAVAH